MSKGPFLYESRVRFGDTDASGRIFYASLLRHFDAAENDFMRSIGVGYRELENQETSFPRVRVECDYTSALRFDDLMTIAVSVERIGGASFTLRFDVTVEGRHAARGKITVVAVKRETERPIPLPDRVRTALNAYAHQSSPALTGTARQRIEPRP